MADDIVKTVEDKAKVDVAALTNKLADIHLRLIVVFMIFIVGFFYFVHRGMVSFDAALDKANAANAALIADTKATAAQTVKDEAVIASAKSQTVIIEKQVATAQTEAVKETAVVAQPDATALQVQGWSMDYLKAKPTLTPDNQLAFAPPDVQRMIATEIDDEYGKKQVTALQSEKEITAQVDKANADTLALTQAELKEAKVTAQDYKAAAVKSKWSRFKGYLITAGIVGVTYEIGKHTK